MSRANDRHQDHKGYDATDRDPVDLRRGRIAEAERIAALAQPDVDRHRRTTPNARVGQRGRAARTGRRGFGAWRHAADGATNHGTGGGRRAIPLTRRACPAKAATPDHRCHPVTSAGACCPLPAPGRLDQPIDVGGGADQDDHAVGAGLVPAVPCLARGNDPRRVGNSTCRSGFHPPWKPTTKTGPI